MARQNGALLKLGVQFLYLVLQGHMFQKQLFWYSFCFLVAYSCECYSAVLHDVWDLCIQYVQSFYFANYVEKFYFMKVI